MIEPLLEFVPPWIELHHKYRAGEELEDLSECTHDAHARRDLRLIVTCETFVQSLWINYEMLHNYFLGIGSARGNNIIMFYVILISCQIFFI